MNFMVGEAFGAKDRFRIIYSDEVYKTIGMINGSFILLQPRLFGLRYDEYLRMLRDEYGVEVWGRKEKSPYINFYFTDRENCRKICRELEERWKILMEKES